MEYLELRRLFEKESNRKIIIKSDRIILDDVFCSYVYKIKDTNSIYVCLGTFKIDNICDIEHGPSDYRVDRDDPRAEYRIYKNIENNDYKQIPIKLCDKFECEHRIIFPNSYFSEIFFYNLQKGFINDLMIMDQEKACIKLL